MRNLLFRVDFLQYCTSPSLWHSLVKILNSLHQGIPILYIITQIKCFLFKYSNHISFQGRDQINKDHRARQLLDVSKAVCNYFNISKLKYNNNNNNNSNNYVC